jgi:hypothetical protein
MYLSRRHHLPALVACIFLVAADKNDEPNVDLRVGKVELRVANYDEMGKTIKDLKGKIVVIDFWQDT